LANVRAEAAGADPRAEIERLVTDAPEKLEQLLTIIVCAYYMSPKVRKRLQSPGQKAAPVFPDEADWYLRDGLLEPVISRGSIYRPTDYRPSERT
jgi:hypothetical protein